MSRIFTLIVLLLHAGLFAQHIEVRQAWLDELGHVQVNELQFNNPFILHNEVEDVVYEQVENWPVKILAHPNFKSFRGVTLADINEDGKDEILVASWNYLFVFSGDAQLLWSLPLTGTATYPPSVADITGDGKLEVVQLTGGIPNNGRVYVIDNTGNVLSGWPVSIGNQWLLSAPTLADLDDSGQMEIIFGVRTVNEIHILKADGTPFNENWPVVLSSIPAFTPSVGDINNDGVLNIIAGSSDGNLYAFDLNGNTLPGYPVATAGATFSYQSPLLADFDGEGQLSIIGANHGDNAQYFIRNSDGTFRSGWPKALPGGGWTYHPPTLADLDKDGIFEVFMAKPISETPEPMLFGYSPEGDMLPGFPITKPGGLESFISVADIDGNGSHDLIFGSNLMIDGQGFVHAWNGDGSGELPGFPLRPTGFTFMNGANLGDVTGDGMLNLVALSYEQNFSATDSTFINVWDLGISLEEANVLFGTYKGSNTRTGLMELKEEVIPDPVFGSIRFANAWQPSRDELVRVWLNGELLLDEAYFGYASNLLELQVNDPITLEVTMGEGEDSVVLHNQTLEMQEDDIWLIVFAGNHEELPALEENTFPLSFYIYEELKLVGDNPEAYDIIFFDAFADELNLANYQLSSYPSFSQSIDNFQGEFNGYLEIPGPSLDITVTSIADGYFIWMNNFNLIQYFEPGSALVMLVAAVYDDNQWFGQVPYPTFYLLPAEEGAFIYPDYAINKVENEDWNDGGLLIFPNPTQDQFTIRSANIIQSIALTELSGKRILHQKVNAGEVRIETPLQPGLYVVTVVTDDGAFVRKLQVQK